ncbi:TPA: aminoglycoside adenylyltransferase domain-containing protein [Streptococcus suis]
MRKNDIQGLLNEICIIFQNELGENLVGIYLHGSLAMDSFTWETSDVDFLVVVEHSLTQIEKIRIIQSLYTLLPKSPPKGLEMSIVLKNCLKPCDYPVPYELHFSNMHIQTIHDNIEKYCDNMQGVDKDLTAHIMVIWHRGIVLCGPAIQQLFEEPCRFEYLDSIWYDIQNSEVTVIDKPVDTILNLCRTLAYLDENIILSKRESGEWELTVCHPMYQPLLEDTLSVYKGERLEAVIDRQLAKRFVEEQMRQIHKSLKINFNDVIEK